jgi:hypothetical protein
VITGCFSHVCLVFTANLLDVIQITRMHQGSKGTPTSTCGQACRYRQLHTPATPMLPAAFQDAFRMLSIYGAWEGIYLVHICGCEGWIKALSRNENILLALNDKLIHMETEVYCCLKRDGLSMVKKIFGKNCYFHLHGNKIRVFPSDVFRFSFALIFFLDVAAIKGSCALHVGPTWPG